MSIKMSDIHELLASIAPPGQKLEEKKQAVKELFEDEGENITNMQGISVLEDLTSYPEF
jgi:hypothetical protein